MAVWGQAGDVPWMAPALKRLPWPDTNSSAGWVQLPHGYLAGPALGSPNFVSSALTPLQRLSRVCIATQVAALIQQQHTPTWRWLLLRPKHFHPAINLKQRELQPKTKTSHNKTAADMLGKEDNKTPQSLGNWGPVVFGPARLCSQAEWPSQLRHQLLLTETTVGAPNCVPVSQGGLTGIWLQLSQRSSVPFSHRCALAGFSDCDLRKRSSPTAV